MFGSYLSSRKIVDSKYFQNIMLLTLLPIADLDDARLALLTIMPTRLNVLRAAMTDDRLRVWVALWVDIRVDSPPGRKVSFFNCEMHNVSDTMLGSSEETHQSGRRTVANCCDIPYRYEQTSFRLDKFKLSTANHIKCDVPKI